MKLETLKKKKDNLRALIDIKETKIKRLQEEVTMHRMSLIKTDELIAEHMFRRNNYKIYKPGTRESLNKILDDIAAEHG